MLKELLLNIKMYLYLNGNLFVPIDNIASVEWNYSNVVYIRFKYPIGQDNISSYEHTIHKSLGAFKTDLQKLFDGELKYDFDLSSY
jgi:hypothetical protein